MHNLAVLLFLLFFRRIISAGNLVVHPKNETRKIGDSFSRRGTDDEAPGVSDSIEAGCGGALGGRGERHRGSAGSAVAGPAFVCVAGQGSTESGSAALRGWGRPRKG